MYLLFIFSERRKRIAVVQNITKLLDKKKCLRVKSSIWVVVRRRALTCHGSCLEIRPRCTTPVRHNDERQIPDRSTSVLSIDYLRHDCNGIFPKKTGRWLVGNLIRRPKGAICPRVFSTEVVLLANYPEID